MALLQDIKFNLKSSKKIMGEIVDIDRKKAEVVAQLVPLINDFYETWHTESNLERRLYKLFSQPPKNKTNEEIEIDYVRDIKDLEREQEDLKKIKRLIKVLESYDDELRAKLNSLNS